MREVAMFVEDKAHELIVGSLVRRMAAEQGVQIKVDVRSAHGGHGRVAKTFRQYLRDVDRQSADVVSLVVVATDTNCKGINKRADEIRTASEPIPVVRAIPDPHVERWLLLDGAAFKQVFGTGCDAPDRKCERNLYKQRLMQAIVTTGRKPPLGGIEHAEEIVEAMDIHRACEADNSFDRFVSDLRAAFRTWPRPPATAGSSPSPV